MKKAARERALIDWCVQRRMAPCDLEPIATRVKEAYRKFRLRYAEAYRPAASQAVAWNNAAMTLIDEGAEPEAWVAAQFEGGDTVPYPNNLSGPHAIDRYRQWLGADAAQDIELQLLSYADIVRTWRQTKSLRDILTDPRHGFPPLFVWCVATIGGCVDIADTAAHAAAAQYMRPAYRATYGKQFSDIVTKLPGGVGCI
jgi:hypothetical protein